MAEETNDQQCVDGKVTCSACEREWPRSCEQGIAVNARGKCIVCICRDGERICMEPYEFRQDGNQIVKNAAAIVRFGKRIKSARAAMTIENAKEVENG